MMTAKYETYEELRESGIWWIGRIPKEWCMLRGKFILASKRELNKLSQCSERLALTMGGVIDRSMDADDGLQPADFTSYQVFEKDDLVFKLIDLENLKTSRVGIVPKRGIMSPAYIRLSAKTTLCTKYFYYFYFDLYLRGIYNELGGQGVRSALSSADLLELSVCVPPIEQQTEIANYLDYQIAKIHRLIEKQQQLIELLKEKRQAVISHAVTKGLDPNVKMKDSGVEWLGTIPAHWGVKPLRYLGTCQNGINIGAEYFGEGYPFVSYGDVYKNESLPESVAGLVQSSVQDRKMYSVIRADVLFTRTSETIEEIGFASTCLKTIGQATFAGFLIRFRPVVSLLDASFSKFYFRNKLLRAFFVKEMNLVTRASLSQDLLKKLPVLLPPIEEQQKIATYIESMTKLFSRLMRDAESAIELIRERRTALISAAVTGKIDVRNWRADKKNAA